MKIISSILLFLAISLSGTTNLSAQSNPETFKLDLEDFTISGLPGLIFFPGG